MYEVHGPGLATVNAGALGGLFNVAAVVGLFNLIAAHSTLKDGSSAQQYCCHLPTQTYLAQKGSSVHCTQFRAPTESGVGPSIPTAGNSTGQDWHKQ